MMNVELLPHFRIAADGLVFLGRQRLQMLPAELDVLRKIAEGHFCYVSAPDEEKVMVGHLESRVIVRKYESRTPSLGQTPCLVISPHIDDAAFSIGGHLSASAATYAFKIVNVFTEDYFSVLNWLRRERNQLRAIRLAEEKLVGRILGCGIVNLAFPDVEERDGKEVGLHDAIAERVRREMPAGATRCWAPYGVGGHPDHLICREIADEVCRAFPQVELLWYEDLPYAAQATEIQRIPSPRLLDVSDHVTDKQRLMEIYQTQISRGGIKAILDYMSRFRNGRSYEAVCG